MAAYPVSHAGVVSCDPLVLRAAVAAFLGRYRGQTRLHTNSDLRIFLRWCDEQGLEPLAAGRTDIERYVRWLQEVRRFQPSTVSRRLSIVVGFYRVCVIDGLLPHSPADYVRRPRVPAESPTLGLGQLQFEALITTARLSTNPNDFALVALLGLLGLRIFEACPPALPTSARNTATASCGCVAKVARSSSSRCHRRSAGPSTERSATGATVRFCATRSAPAWTVMLPPVDSSTWPPLRGSGCRGCIH
jgi:Phage integrase, N-terminal SAM-like domain